MPFPQHCIECDKPIAGGARQCADCIKKEENMSNIRFTMADAGDFDLTNSGSIRMSSSTSYFEEDEISTDEIVEMMEKDYPITTSAFKELQREQYELFCIKQHDYGPKNISVGTELKTRNEVQVALTGLWFRMNDKIQRAKNLLMGERKSAVPNESLEDSFLDLSNYGIMAALVKRDKWGK
jgi:hypothetical protein